ncbi:MAG: RNA polymerase sigma-54 factor, partial [Nitrospinota bacterium]|nr:RNA polymerase sigma-54 factor [Nitrospinota bacterium]
MKMNLNLKMNQKLVMTPMLQQAIKLLPLARLELAQLVRQEIIDNPVLEEILEDDIDSMDERKKEDEEESYEFESSQDSQEQEIDWDSYFQNNIDQGMSAE